MFTFLFVACMGGMSNMDSPKTDDSTGTSDDSTAEESQAPACATITPGDDWAWEGRCPRMTTPVAITVDECTLTLDYASVGGMTMGMPYSATIEEDAVTFGDGDSVTGCVGTVISADSIEGTCDGPCTFTLSR